MVFGPEQGLKLIDRPELPGALELSDNFSERAFLARRLAEVAVGTDP